MVTRASISILCLGWVVVPGSTIEPSSYPQIDPATVAAYKKIGGKYGGFAIDDDGGVRCSWFKGEPTGFLPGFSILSRTNGALPKLPPVQTAFGLDLHLASATDADLKELNGLKNLAMLDLHGTKVTDAGLKELTGLQKLTALDLRGTKVTNAGLTALKGLPNLKVLSLASTRVTDAGLREISDLKNLESLSLAGAKVTDAGLKELKDLKKLGKLYLGNTKAMGIGLNLLQDQLRDLRVVTDKPAGSNGGNSSEFVGPASVFPSIEAVADAEFRTLVEQDARNIVAVLSEVKIKKTADRAVKSNALMIAAHAQSRISKNQKDDAKLVTLRDLAVKIATTPKRQLPGALADAKRLSVDIAADDKLKLDKVNLLAATTVDVEELMFQFKKTAVGGLGIEEDIKSNAKKLTMKPQATLALGQRVLTTSEFLKVMEPVGGFNARKPKKAWEGFNKDMQDAATELTKAANANDKKSLQTAWNKLDASCVACHTTFK